MKVRFRWPLILIQKLTCRRFSHWDFVWSSMGLVGWLCHTGSWYILRRDRDLGGL